MAMTKLYETTEPARQQIDSLTGPMLLEFGTPWCGHCSGAQPLLTQAFTAHPLLPHLKIEDGKGRPLGRSFRVTLWPTLIFLRDGREVARLVRPTSSTEISEAMSQVAP